MKIKGMLKFVSLLMAMLMVLCTVAACGDTTKPEDESTTAAIPEESTAEPAVETEADTTAEEITTVATTDVETEALTESATETETESVTLSPEEEKILEIEAYLATVKYRDYELTGEKAPYYMGRWFEKEIEGETHMVTVTDGSHLYFLTDGATEIRVTFTNITTDIVTPMFAYSIDGAEIVRQPISNGTVALPDGGMHTVRIVADGMNEGNGTYKWNQEKGFALKSVSVDSGELYGIKPTEKVVFFYGDSITEGINALGREGDSNANSATGSYTWITANLLGITPYFIGHGGSGLVPSGSFAPMIDAIDKLSANRDLADHPNADITPDLIVIAHGANDALTNNDKGISSTEFANALRAAITRLQEKYPGVTIIYFMPIMESWRENVQDYGTYVDQVVTEFENVHAVHTRDWGIMLDVDYSDYNLHPNAQGALKMARQVTLALRNIMGKDFFD